MIIKTKKRMESFITLKRWKTKGSGNSKEEKNPERVANEVCSN